MSNYTVSSDVDTLLKSPSFDDVVINLGVVTNTRFNNLYTTVQANSASWANSNITNILGLSGYSYTLATSSLNYYIRKYHNDSHIVYIPYDGSSAFVSGMTFTVRNAGLSSMTLSAASNVTLNYDAVYDGNIIEKNNTSQLIYIGNNVWDIV